MGLKRLDLKDTVLKKISIDEFEPKTGDSKDVSVIGFCLTEESSAQDLYNYVNNGYLDFRDVEVSPNPNTDGYYMVFVEVDRNDKLVEYVKDLVSDLENVCGNLNWQVSTHLTDDYYPLNDQELAQYIITDPDRYVTREQYQKQNQEESIKSFLKDSALHHVSISEDIINLKGSYDQANLKYVAYGNAKQVMKDLNIHESALSTGDSVFRRFNSMLGEMQAVPIDRYIVLFHPNNDNVLVTELC